MTTRVNLQPQRSHDSLDDEKVLYDVEGKRVVEQLNPVMQAPDTPNTFWGTLKYMFDW